MLLQQGFELGSASRQHSDIHVELTSGDDASDLFCIDATSGLFLVKKKKETGRRVIDQRKESRDNSRLSGYYHPK